MAADLVRRHVAVIATLSSTAATVAAKAATSTIPIFFLMAENPVELGLVASLSRPGGNITGIGSQNVELVEKRLGLLHEIAPQSAVTALVNPGNPNAETIAKILKVTAGALGFELHVLDASTDAEIEQAYRALVPGSALLIATDPFFFNRRALLIALSARHAVPTIYDNKDFADGGGLMSYGTNIEASWELAGLYVSRILKGEKPADIPVMQPTKFEFVLNLKTAKTLGLTVPPTLLATADEVIE
jgi:putative ABC transport system substrate-binding protein